jgi:HlyD family secretion protein
MKKILTIASAVVLTAACGQSEREYDATGVFEATEVTVSAEQSGTLLQLALEEGDSVEAGREVGLIDTTQIWLKMQQTEATKAVYQSQKPDMEKQIAATRQQLAKAKTERQRYRELVADGAAPRKMLDDAANQVEVLQRQLDAQVSSLHTQLSTLNSQASTTDVQMRQLSDQLGKCHVKAPTAGTVLEKYAEPGEFVAPGKPLFKVGNVSRMYMRAYVTSAQLQQVKVGQPVKVFADYGGDKRKEYSGTVSWISSRSEFTPKTILTDDERADLVYAVKIAVNNDGNIKIGMYGEVSFE